MSLELLVLGSGGPFVNPRRASSAYVLSVDGQPRLLIDAGGGCFERMGRAGVRPAALDAVLLTHLHIDHSGGLAPVVFAAYMEGRERPLTVVGPAPRDEQPGVRRFADLLFGRDGAWSYMHSFDGFGIEPVEVDSDPDGAAAADVLEAGGLRVRAVAVPHGMMPAVAYRVEHADGTVVLSGDVSGAHPPLVSLAAGCDLLVCDLAVPERKSEHGHLHAKPGEVGQMARDSGCATLLVTHVMAELEDELPDALRLVRRRYEGPLVVAEDMLRVVARR